jgi:hypothetical protein
VADTIFDPFLYQSFSLNYPKAFGIFDKLCSGARTPLVKDAGPNRCQASAKARIALLGIVLTLVLIVRALIPL